MLSWLKGYELPPVGHEEEPYVWLLRAFSNSDEAHRQEMARRLADFLHSERPHQRLNEKYDDETLYNLLCLSGGLRCRNQLAEPLFQVYDFFNNNPEGRTLLAKRSRYNLSGALRDALIANQVSPHFQDVWKQMFEGQPHELLRGSRFSGAEGILRMPGSATEPDKPAIEDTGWMLTKMVEYLESEEKRHRTFRRLLERTKEAWPDYPNWDEDLLRQAIKYQWPEWAILRLDTLVVPLDNWTEGMQHYLVWEFYLNYLQKSTEQRSYRLIEPFRHKIISEVCLDGLPRYMLNAVYLRVEYARLHGPDSNYRNTRLSADEDLKNLREEWEQFKKGWPEADTMDSIFRVLMDGRSETLAASVPKEKQKVAWQRLKEAQLATAAGGV
ncbi:MAG: hypothetical protein WCF57_07920 [Pyrinomonadaceae bacterium]